MKSREYTGSRRAERMLDVVVVRDPPFAGLRDGNASICRVGRRLGPSAYRDRQHLPIDAIGVRPEV